MPTPSVYATLRPAEAGPLDEAASIVCSFDLNGNVIEVNHALAHAIGYSREHLLRTNLISFLDPQSYQFIHEHLLAQMGGEPPRELEIQGSGKDGSMISLRVICRLLYEGGQPAAAQIAGRLLTGAPSADTGATDPHELARLAGHLKQLHRLSTSTHESIDSAFEDYLSTGCRIFGLSVGTLLQMRGEMVCIRAAHGSESLRQGIELPRHATHCFTLADRLRTLTFSDTAPLSELHPAFRTYIGTPILLGSEVFGTLSFSSPSGDFPRSFSSAEKEVIELMARGLGRVILEHANHLDCHRSEALERGQNRVLEMVAQNQDLDHTLLQVVHMVEGQRPELFCALLLLNGDQLCWSVAPSFPPETLWRSQPLRIPVDPSDLPAGEMVRSTVAWDDIRRCPLWAERSYFAGQIGIASCLSTPILSSDGALLGVAALHYRDGLPPPPSDIDLLQLGSRLAAIAIEHRRLSERLEFQARHDLLTGLPNRFYFIELLEAAMEEAGRRGQILPVLFIDLDRFKQINDTLGHAFGDRLLKEVGARLQRMLTVDDLAGRMGGDEFTIALARQPDERTAMQSAQEFLNALRAPYSIDGYELFVTASIGMAIFPGHGARAHDLLRNADRAMYDAKNNGNNSLEIFHAESQATRLERFRLENALRRALDNREFDLRYQPLVSVDGKLEGLEALLTWQHPIYGTITPKQFIPIAEETGIIIPVGTWVLRQACLQGARWLKAGYRSVVISVNVSALQFERRDFVETVAAALALSSFPPENLELELTESYVMRDLPGAAQRLTEIRDLGVSISIDDFGTGYSSLSYLNKLPVDSLKIDQSFLRSLQEPEGSLPVVLSIVRLAHGMNLKVVAEGVETLAELDLVRLLGCDKVQGHVYGPSLTREQAELLLATSGDLTPYEKMN